MLDKFYAEYTIDGIFYNGFYSRGQFANLTFCPDTEVLRICVADKKTDSWKEVYSKHGAATTRKVVQEA